MSHQCKADSRPTSLWEPEFRTFHVTTELSFRLLYHDGCNSLTNTQIRACKERKINLGPESDGSRLRSVVTEPTHENISFPLPPCLSPRLSTFPLCIPFVRARDLTNSSSESVLLSSSKFHPLVTSLPARPVPVRGQHSLRVSARTLAPRVHSKW